MNFSKILAPLGERITALTELVQEMTDNLREQTETQKKILAKLNEIQGNDKPDSEQQDNKSDTKIP